MHAVVRGQVQVELMDRRDIKLEHLSELGEVLITREFHMPQCTVERSNKCWNQNFGMF